MGSGCGSVGRVIASKSRGPVISKNIYWTITVNCIEKTKINKKRPKIAHFLKRVLHTYNKRKAKIWSHRRYNLLHWNLFNPNFLPTHIQAAQMWLTLTNTYLIKCVQSNSDSRLKRNVGFESKTSGHSVKSISVLLSLPISRSRGWLRRNKKKNVKNIIFHLITGPTSNFSGFLFLGRTVWWWHLACCGKIIQNDPKETNLMPKVFRFGIFWLNFFFEKDRPNPGLFFLTSFWSFLTQILQKKL